MKKRKESGFTLLELIIVIGIIAILSVALVIVLNPAETLKKARDAQRISDLSTLKTAIGLYLTNTTTPYLGSTSANTACKGTIAGGWEASDTIFYSTPSSSAITDTTLDGGTGSVPADAQVATPALTDGTGWIPINFGSLTGGSPISNLPVDPVNSVSSLSAVASTDLVYRYACVASPLGYEIDAQLESTAYTSTDDKRASDGGNNAYLYETGTNMAVLGAGADF